MQQVAPTARGPRLLVRLGLFAFCAGLLLLLSSRPADAAERREPQLLDPVGTTLKATAREVDSFAGRATGSGSSTVARTVDAARQAVAPPPRPAPGAARPPVAATVKRGAPAVPFTGFEGTGSAAGVASASPTYPVRLAADGASSPATRSIRSWPALTGAVSLPGFPASAELPAGGPDPLSTSSGAGFALAALAAVLLLHGPLGRGRARPDRSGVIWRSYLPLVSPA